MDALELPAHPVWLRIVHAMRGEREPTTGRLRARIPDTSKAMVYRHGDLLTASGIPEAAGERRVRGVVERRHRLRHATSKVVGISTSVSQPVPNSAAPHHDR
ncbi:hypothetical protein [Nonomuraea jabiensis]|uniref:hypothetical protein n=1 Tax=Nonomuraea jabiensis TaxID=882448 RepID=UPI0036C8C00D